MFRIRRIHDDARPVDQNAIEQVKAIMKSHFSTLSEENGKMLGELRLPLLVVQEGGYRTRSLGINALSFFKGLYKQYESPIS